MRTLPRLGRVALSNIPGPRQPLLPVLTTVKFLADPLSATRRMYDTFGPVFKNRTIGGWRVGLLGPEANELVLFDRDKSFSSQDGWGTLLGRLFPRGLMLMDFEEHRAHRRTLATAFKSGPMEGYLELLQDRIGDEVRGWTHQDAFRLYPAIKRMTLSTAAHALLGEPFGPEA
ncbi:MAG: cytochrome P450, partial [Sphingomonas sp.]